MEIPLKIERNKDCTTCNPDCIFLDYEYFRHSGTCLLFRETLTPVMEYSDIVGWKCCTPCNIIATKILTITTDDSKNETL